MYGLSSPPLDGRAIDSAGGGRLHDLLPTRGNPSASFQRLSPRAVRPPDENPRGSGTARSNPRDGRFSYPHPSVQQCVRFYFVGRQGPRSTQSWIVHVSYSGGPLSSPGIVGPDGG